MTGLEILASVGALLVIALMVLVLPARYRQDREATRRVFRSWRRAVETNGPPSLIFALEAKATKLDQLPPVTS